jgi:CII-binding regulator of phage lambda lysogenization HflD
MELATKGMTLVTTDDLHHLKDLAKSFEEYKSTLLPLKDTLSNDWRRVRDLLDKISNDQRKIDYLVKETDRMITALNVTLGLISGEKT